jgi:hypothetical protein
MKKFQEFIVESELDDLRRDLMSLGYVWFTATIEAWGISRVSERADRYHTYYEGNSTGYGETKEKALRHAILSFFMAIENPDHYNKITSKNIVDAEIKETEFQSALKNGRINFSFLTSDYDLYGTCPVYFGEDGEDHGLLGISYLTVSDTSKDP